MGSPPDGTPPLRRHAPFTEQANGGRTMEIAGTATETRTGGAEAVLTPRARSTAMWLMPIAALVEALITVLVMSSIGFIPPLVVFLVAWWQSPFSGSCAG